MADKLIKCGDCKMDFNFTEGEQSFYASKGLSEPKRCKPCREQRKNNNGQQEAPRGGTGKQWTNGDAGGDDRGQRRGNSRSRRGDRGHDDY